MTMFATTVYLDRFIPRGRLATAFAEATGVHVDAVRVITDEEFERLTGPWFLDSDLIGVKTSTVRGDFPFVIDMFSRPAPDLHAVLATLARLLDVTILTDNYGVNPLSDAEWMMVGPDGSSVAIIADPEEFGADNPAIVLEPASRAAYAALRVRRSVETVAP